MCRDILRDDIPYRCMDMESMMILGLELTLENPVSHRENLYLHCLQKYICLFESFLSFLRPCLVTMLELHFGDQKFLED